jgi:hypothetical protein
MACGISMAFDNDLCCPALASWFEVKTYVVGIVVFETLQQGAHIMVSLQIATV